MDLELLPARRGHFLMESGHHADLWLEVEQLCYDTEPVRQGAEDLARRLDSHEFDAVCGPLVEGAFVALFVADRLEVPFTYSTLAGNDAGAGLYRMKYRVPGGLRARLAGQRVVVVNDVISAGSAVRATIVDLRALGASPVGIATLAVLGTHAPQLAAEYGCWLETLLTVPNEIWEPAACPMCARGEPLETRGA